MTTQSQIKINLPSRLKEFIESKAANFGMPVASYVRHLILKDIENMQYPVHEASSEVEKAYKKAVRDYKKGKTTPIASSS